MATRRNPAKELFWRQVFTHWQRSGLSVRAFCTQESLSEPSFYVWRRELVRRSGGAPAAAASPCVARGLSCVPSYASHHRRRKPAR